MIRDACMYVCARCFGSISTRSVEQLEVLSAQLEQMDEVLLHLVGADCRRVDRFVEKVTTYASNCVVLPGMN